MLASSSGLYVPTVHAGRAKFDRFAMSMRNASLFGWCGYAHAKGLGQTVVGLCTHLANLVLLHQLRYFAWIFNCNRCVTNREHTASLCSSLQLIRRMTATKWWVDLCFYIGWRSLSPRVSLPSLSRSKEKKKELGMEARFFRYQGSAGERIITCESSHRNDLDEISSFLTDYPLGHK